jgi:ubiquinone/menaquinone biosynthesis C-methylase UbiE
MERILEPELMDDAAQALAYARADFADVNRGFVDRFRTMFPDLAGSRVVDLGCGPADIPIRLARTLPRLAVTGVEASAAMIGLAHEAVRTAGLETSIHLVRARLPALPFPSGTFDAVIANSLLHHLAEPGVFWREVQRLGRPRAGVLVMDLCRPDSPSHARDLAETYAGGESPLLKRDFYNSLRAAFTPAEVARQLARQLPQLSCRVVSDRHWVVTGRLP